MKDEILQQICANFQVSLDQLKEAAEFILEPISDLLLDIGDECLDEFVEVYVENYGKPTVMAVIECIKQGLTSNDFTI